MRVAAIDVGTNSTRLLVAEEAPGGFRSLERQMRITRLGQGVDRRRLLDPEALHRTLRVIADYAASCGEYGVERLRVTGTSAVRDAHNRDEFFHGVRMLTGTEAEMLSGEEEGLTTFRGALADIARPGPYLVVDIGGGSTEFIYGEDAPGYWASIDIGCVRMFEKHLRSDPPTSDQLAALRAEVEELLDPVQKDLQVTRGTTVVGVAGTVTQLAALKSGTPLYDPEVTHLMTLSHSDVRNLLRRLASLPYEKRKRVRALEQGRADVILAGAQILLTIMERFDAAEVVVSEKDILDGLVLGLLEGPSVPAS
jgi:exopolyphosphatase/guanosine-5'-triphosphate,3'-diphosphate pyrophosphatase